MRTVGIASSSGGTGGAPAVTIAGTTAVGSVLTASITAGYGGTLTYQWVRGADGASDLTGASNISGATSSTYTLVSGDIGRVIGCLVSGLTYQGRTSGVVAGVAPSVTTAPAIVGTPAVGTAVSYTTGTYSGTTPITKAVQWLLDGNVIVGETGSTYTPIEADEGKTLAIRETASNAWGSAASTSSGAIIAAAGAGGPVSSGNWFFASAFTSPPNDRYYSSTYSDIIFEAEHIIGSGARSVLRLMIPNWALTSGNNSHAALISKASVECNGVRVPVTFGGSRSVTMAAGLAKQESDDIPPSAFGLTEFAVGQRVFVAFGGPAVSGVNRFILAPRKSPSARCRMYQYNPATTTVSIDAPGALSFTGSDWATMGPTGTIVNVNTEIAHTLIGKFVGADEAVYAAAGDSIEWGLGATDGTNNVGSWLHRGFFDADLISNPIAHHFFCLSGIKYQNFLAVSTQLAAWFPYANRGYDGLGTNDFGQNPGTAVTLAQCQGFSQSLWTLMRNNGISKIYKHKLLGSITVASNNTATTEAAQVIQGVGWDVGGNVENYNAWLDTQISGSALTGIIPIIGIMGTNPRKWAMDGVTVKLMSVDGLHLSEYAQTLMAPVWRATRVAAA